MLSGLPEHQEAVVVFPPAACSRAQTLLGCAPLGTIPIRALPFWLGAAGQDRVGEGTALSLITTLGPQAGLSSTDKVQFGGNTLPLPFLKHGTVHYEAAEQVWVKSNAVL